MRATQTPNGTKLWLSARDTQTWAIRPGQVWPCSVVAGHTLRVEFDRHGDLIDLAADGYSDSVTARNIPSDELNAITSDHLEAVFGPNHPAIRR